MTTNLRRLFLAFGTANAAGDQAEARRLLAELDRRIALAETDHPIMWRPHLDETEPSVSRQRDLLRNGDNDVERGFRRNPAIEFVRPDLVEEHNGRSGHEERRYASA